MAARTCLVLFLIFAVGVPAFADYQRPINQDCVAAGSGAPVAASSVTYFPTQYQVVGERVQGNPDTVKVAIAKDFQVEYFPNFKVVTNSKVNETYVLYQCGTAAPSSSLFSNTTKFFEIPLTSVSVPETVPLAFLVRMGLADRLHSVSSFATSACGQQLLACNRTAPSTSALTNLTRLAATLNQVDGIASSSKVANPKVFAFSAATDPGPLNRAEWIKFLGLFFNTEAAASSQFADINATYVQNSVPRSLPLGGRPTMAFVQNLTYFDGTSLLEDLEVSLAAYKVAFTIDAGAQPPNRTALEAIPGIALSPFDVTNSTYQFKWGPGSGFATKQDAVAAFQTFLKRVDIIVDETYAMDPTSYTMDSFLQSFSIASNQTASLPALANKKVFREDGLISPTGGLDWFEGAIAQPDKVLLDFRKAVAPAMYQAYNATWIRNVAAGVTSKLLSSSACAQNTACSAKAPAAICPFVKACASGSPVMRSSEDGACIYPTCAA
ncbi:hypothetical protein WJX72_009772 [[Myrmecia] bisecta]|uniref:Uncharacterized protein n=1 Tax=[Myrmecia] bisecta TaxID=41462 RepID=A0AAW1Q6C9_9CHLO